MRVEANNKQELFTAAGDREVILVELDKLIQKNAPNLPVEFFSSTSLTGMAYGLIKYKNSKGIEGEWPLIALAPQKNYIAMYVCAFVDGNYFAELYKDRLGKVSVGRSCIRVKKLGDLNMPVVAEMVSDIANRVAAGEKLFSM